MALARILLVCAWLTATARTRTSFATSDVVHIAQHHDNGGETTKSARKTKGW